MSSGQDLQLASSLSKPQVLFLYGLPDDNDAKIVIRNGRREMVVMGSSNVYPSLSPYFKAHEVLLMGDAEEHEIRLGPRPQLVFNQISDPDTHTISLQRADMICQQAGVPIINPPRLVAGTRRELIAAKLQGKPGLIVPQTIRRPLSYPRQAVEYAEQSGLRFPLLVRRCGAHGGKQLAKLDSADDLDELHALALDGSDFYFTEFVDCRGEDGMYRKCRIALVDGRPLLIHWLLHEEWNVHTVMAREYALAKGGSLAEEEAQAFERYGSDWPERTRIAFHHAWQAVGLDYFGMDCFLNQAGDLLIFEINANMNMLPPQRNRFPRQEFRVRRREELTQALVALVQSRLAGSSFSLTP